MATVSVVSEGELVIGSPRADGIGLLPEFLGLLLVVLQVADALEGIRVARGQRRGKVNGRSAGAVEHLVADVLTVDGHGDGLTTQGAFFGTSFEVLQAGRNGELLDDGTGLVVGLHGLIGFEGLGGGGRHGFHHIEGAGLDVGVGCVILGVDLEGHTVVLRGSVALVVRVLHEHDLVVVIPGLELVRTVADWSLTEGIRVIVEGFRQRSECGIAHLDGEHGIRLVQVDGELVIVDDLQTFKLLVTLEVVGVLQRVIALDGGEEGRAQLRVLRISRIAPSLGEGLGGHIGAIGELPTILELDVVLGGVIVGGNGLSHFVGSIAFGVEGNQTGEQQINRLATTGLVGVARDERVLRFGIVCGDDVGTFSGGVAAVGRATAAQQHAKSARGGSESQCFLLHIIILLFDITSGLSSHKRKRADLLTDASLFGDSALFLLN